MIRVVMAALLLGLVATAAQTGLQHGVVFDQGSPLASNAQIARRMLSPLGVARVNSVLAQSHTALRDQPIDRVKESFVLYVPAKMPEAGYGLLVFVPPWEEEGIPRGWPPVLEDKGIIIVAAARSGNAENVLARRLPLALIGARNVMAKYRIDPARIYVGGMSGGSRVAMKLALGWPDLFKGALLNAGSDPVGRAGTHVPPRALMLAFQEKTRLVYVTGDRDQANQDSDITSVRSMRDYCMFNITRITMHDKGHEPADPSSLGRALDMLDAPVTPDAKLADCRAGLDAEWTKALDGVEAQIRDGKRDAARASLDELDLKYGGLAAPRSLALDAELAQPAQK